MGVNPPIPPRPQPIPPPECPPQGELSRAEVSPQLQRGATNNQNKGLDRSLDGEGAVSPGCPNREVAPLRALKNAKKRKIGHLSERKRRFSRYVSPGLLKLFPPLRPFSSGHACLRGFPHGGVYWRPSNANPLPNGDGHRRAPWRWEYGEDGRRLRWEYGETEMGNMGMGSSRGGRRRLSAGGRGSYLMLPQD